MKLRMGRLFQNSLLSSFQKLQSNGNKNSLTHLSLTHSCLSRTHTYTSVVTQHNCVYGSSRTVANYVLLYIRARFLPRPFEHAPPALRLGRVSVVCCPNPHVLLREMALAEDGADLARCKGTHGALCFEDGTIFLKNETEILKFFCCLERLPSGMESKFTFCD